MIFKEEQGKKILLAILAISFFTRIVGVNYGLPLSLVGDETPYVAAGLKMIELKTVFPKAHYDQFKRLLYFSPYISYIYLIPFAAVLVLGFLAFNGDFSDFIKAAVADPSPFYITARTINILFGIMTVWLIYKIAKNIFQKESTALFSSAFLGFSLLHTNLSFLGRDWVINVFVFTLAFYFLSSALNKTKRYLLASVTAGLGVGLHLLGGFIGLFIALWYFFENRKSFKIVLKDKIPYLALLIFASLWLAAYHLYPFGFLLENKTIGQTKDFLGFLKMFKTFFGSLAVSEPAFFAFVLIGAIFLFFKLKKYFFLFALFITAYIAVFYLLFFYQDRFSLYLYPLLALTAGYGLENLGGAARNKKKVSIVAGGLTFLIMLAMVIKLDVLLLKNDARLQARKWMEKNIPAQSKIIVAAPLTRLSSTPEAIKQQEKIQADSLRQVDVIEKETPQLLKYPTFHAINLYTITEQSSASFYQNIEEYVRNNRFEYIFWSEGDYGNDYLKGESWQKLSEMGRPLRSWNGSQSLGFDFTSAELGNFLNLFKIENPGPDTIIHYL